jgi:hypothetical protein
MLSPRSRGKGSRRPPVPTSAGRTHATEWHKRKAKRLAEYVEPERVGEHLVQFEYGDVVKVHNEYGGDFYVITDVDPHKPRHPYVAVKLMEYKLTDDGPPVGRIVDRERHALNDEHIAERVRHLSEREASWYWIGRTRIRPLRRVEK